MKKYGRMAVLRRSWCLGSQQFKQQQLEALEGKVGEHHFGQLRLAQGKAERIKELTRLGCQEADLAARRKHDSNKVELAQRLRREREDALGAANCPAGALGHA